MAKREKPYPELVRERLRAGVSLAWMAEAEKELKAGGCSPTRIKELDLLLSNYRWRIDKMVPSLKSIEHTGGLDVRTEIRISVGG